MDLKAKFKSELEEAPWSMLEEHHKREALVMVTPNLDLIEVACWLAEDNKEAVAKHLISGDISKPTQDSIEIWEKNSEQKFQFLIVQPFVVAQIKSS